jgi:hypothetical protein
VLERAGFTAEGLARRYLKINGQWQDHRLFARLSDDPVPQTLDTREAVPVVDHTPTPPPATATHHVGGTA